MEQVVPEVSESPDEFEDEGTTSWSWLSWLLVVACLAPPLLLVEVARRALGGDYDAEYFGGFAGITDDPTVEEMVTRLDVSLGQRFTVLWVQLDLPGPLLGVGVAALATAAVVLAGRPAWLVPQPWGRRIAACGLWLGAVESVAAAVGLLQIVADDGGRASLQLSWYGAPEGFPEVAGAFAVLVPVAVVAGVAGFVVWPGTSPTPAGPPADQEPEVTGTADGTSAEHVTASPLEATPDRAAEPTVEAVVEAPTVTFPVVPDAERTLYRRPTHPAPPPR